MLSLGKTNKLIARDLEFGEATVKAHLRLLMKRLGLSSRTQVALYFTKMNPTEVEGGAAADDAGDDSELEGRAYAFMPGAGRHWHGVNVHA